MSINNGKPLEVTPVSAWLDDYELVTMPSGKVVGLRQTDILSLILEDGTTPNFLIQFIQGHMGALPINANEQAQLDEEDLIKLSPILNKLTIACYANPPIVNTMEEVKRGEGLLLHMVSLEDKISLILWGMGGARAVEAAGRFFEQQKRNIESSLQSNSVEQATKRNTRRKK